MVAEWNNAVRGKRVGRAFSSLTQWSCELDDEHGIVIDAKETASGPAIEASIVAKAEMPQNSDAVCQVDWNWIRGSVVAEVAATSSAVRFVLEPAGPLAISVQTWQGKPFLSFQPYRAPAK